jgi:hypothetical protein
MQKRRFDVRRPVVELRDVAGELLAERERTASCRWVRPIFTTLAKAFALSASAIERRETLGRRCSLSDVTAATCMAVGKTSFDD